MKHTKKPTAAEQMIRNQCAYWFWEWRKRKQKYYSSEHTFEDIAQARFMALKSASWMLAFERRQNALSELIEANKRKEMQLNYAEEVQAKMRARAQDIKAEMEATVS